MALTQFSDYDDLVREYDRCAAYEESSSLAQARRFITICRMILRHPARAVRRGEVGSEVEFNLEIVRSELKDAQAWVAENEWREDATGNSPVLDAMFYDFESRT